MAAETDFRSRPSRPPMLAMKPSSTGSLYCALHSSEAILCMLCSALTRSAGLMALSSREQHVMKIVVLDTARGTSSSPGAAGKQLTALHQWQGGPAADLVRAQGACTGVLQGLIKLR